MRIKVGGAVMGTLMRAGESAGASRRPTGFVDVAR